MLCVCFLWAIRSELFDGDHEKVKQLNEKVCRSIGFDKWVAVSGQTYTRKVTIIIIVLMYLK